MRLPSALGGVRSAAFALAVICAASGLPVSSPQSERHGRGGNSQARRSQPLLASRPRPPPLVPVVHPVHPPRRHVLFVNNNNPNVITVYPRREGVFLSRPIEFTQILKNPHGNFTTVEPRPYRFFQGNRILSAGKPRTRRAASRMPLPRSELSASTGKKPSVAAEQPANSRLILRDFPNLNQVAYTPFTKTQHHEKSAGLVDKLQFTNSPVGSVARRRDGSSRDKERSPLRNRHFEAFPLEQLGFGFKPFLQRQAYDAVRLRSLPLTMTLPRTASSFPIYQDPYDTTHSRENPRFERQSELLPHAYKNKINTEHASVHQPSERTNEPLTFIKQNITESKHSEKNSPLDHQSESPSSSQEPVGDDCSSENSDFERLDESAPSVYEDSSDTLNSSEDLRFERASASFSPIYQEPINGVYSVKNLDFVRRSEPFSITYQEPSDTVNSSGNLLNERRSESPPSIYQNPTDSVYSSGYLVPDRRSDSLSPIYQNPIDTVFSSDNLHFGSPPIYQDSTDGVYSVKSFDFDRRVELSPVYQYPTGNVYSLGNVLFKLHRESSPSIIGDLINGVHYARKSDFERRRESLPLAYQDLTGSVYYAGNLFEQRKESSRPFCQDSTDSSHSAANNRLQYFSEPSPPSHQNPIHSALPVTENLPFERRNILPPSMNQNPTDTTLSAKSLLGGNSLVYAPQFAEYMAKQPPSLSRKSYIDQRPADTVPLSNDQPVSIVASLPYSGSEPSPVAPPEVAPFLGGNDNIPNIPPASENALQQGERVVSVEFNAETISDGDGKVDNSTNYFSKDQLPSLPSILETNSPKDISSPKEHHQAHSAVHPMLQEYKYAIENEPEEDSGFLHNTVLTAPQISNKNFEQLLRGDPEENNGKPPSAEQLFPRLGAADGGSEDDSIQKLPPIPGNEGSGNMWDYAM